MLTTILSVIGILSLSSIDSGGVYFLISHVLGSRFGGAIGLIYCFGQVSHFFSKEQLTTEIKRQEKEKRVVTNEKIIKNVTLASAEY